MSDVEGPSRPGVAEVAVWQDAHVAAALASRVETRTQARILRLLRDEGPLSRAELADRLRVSRTTVAAEVGRLVELELTEDAGPATSRGGRRSTILDFRTDLRFAGVDIGATSLDVAITDGRLRVLAKAAEEIDVRDGPETVLPAVLRLLRDLLEAQPGPWRLAGAGIGVPGPVDFNRGVPVSPPIMPGWDGYPVRDTMARELGCPVLLDNDVNVMALGEQHSGVARAAQDFLFVKIGTGIGCGIMVGGQMYRGVNGCAGDIGHITVEETGPVCACGEKGCLEAVFGGAALARDALAAAKAGRSPVLSEILERKGALTAADVGAAATRGDPCAVRMVREGGARVGLTLAGLVSFINPGLIVIGGRVANLGHLLLSEIRGVVYRRSLPLATGNMPIVLSELGDDAGVVGAARMVSDALYALE
ncbi:ROK family protein [Marinactinospora thermotolerans]|uniref:ROK family protein (Putative glucokinase) n=1 Tax=Marinactinospora thermotolerans DSM 45154 TaxID=1122192 RepID=A0A1T4SNI1_9ACTN|nr:ROK family transcriptional regulator [Marinactinospora thermotolerans]SKA29800.1 ROK family protein (putative glucokinase) [Marinactinospora thermotolerans DSM 45154]